MFKPRETGPVRMPVGVGVPSPGDLEFVLGEAQKNWKRAVELSFKTLGGTRVFTMVIQCDSAGEPSWTLTVDTPSGSSLVWIHTSQDVALILDLVRAEFDREAAEEALAPSPIEIPQPSRATPAPASPAVQPTVQSTVQSTAGAERAPAGTGTFSDSDNRAIESFLGSVCRPDTGLFAYPAFLYFLDQEYRRLCLGGQPFSIAIFKMRFRDSDGRVSAHELSPEAIRAAALRIGNGKRAIDVLVHYGPFDFGLLLPHADGHAAEILIRSFEKSLSESPLLPAAGTNRLATCFGIASMPGDAGSPQQLIAAALDALRAAANGPDNVMLYKNLRSR